MKIKKFLKPFILTYLFFSVAISFYPSFDFYSLKGIGAVDFRSDNITNFDSLEKNSIDLYSSLKSVYLQDRERKVKTLPVNPDAIYTFLYPGCFPTTALLSSLLQS